MYAQMHNSMHSFRADAYFFYDSDEAAAIGNSLLLNNPGTSNLTGICRDDHYVLAASCRLDNRYELAKQLNLREEQSDHEYLLAAYTAYGQDCTQYLLGDFSFVVWDITQQTLFMAKDHLGIRPLFYYQDEEKFVFATSIHAIKSIIRPALNEKYIAKELKRHKQDVEDTFFKNIHRLKPAHSATFSLKNVAFVSKRYWELKQIDISSFKTPAAIYEELNKRFTEAVVCRTRTHRNIGCQLSGGCDSSAIAVLISRNISKTKLHTYSFVLSEKTRAYSKNGIDEQQMQQSVIDYAGLLPENHHKVEDLHFKEVFEQLERTNLVMGGYANADCVWQDSMFKMAAENQVSVMMSGFMGDECVSTYGTNYYYDYIGNREIKNLVRFLFKKPINGAKKIVSYYRSMIRGRSIKDYKKIMEKYNLLKADSQWHQLREDKNFAFYPTFKEYLKNRICRPFSCLRAESENAYAFMYGIEMVYPLADIRLLELVYSLPTEMFAPVPYYRALFRNMCIGILPEDVRTQPKLNGAMTMAFAEYWKKNQLKELKNYQLKDELNMFIENPDFNSKELEIIDRILVMYQLDYHISKGHII